MRAGAAESPRPSRAVRGRSASRSGRRGRPRELPPPVERRGGLLGGGHIAQLRLGGDSRPQRLRAADPARTLAATVRCRPSSAPPRSGRAPRGRGRRRSAPIARRTRHERDVGRLCARRSSPRHRECAAPRRCRAAPPPLRPARRRPRSCRRVSSRRPSPWPAPRARLPSRRHRTWRRRCPGDAVQNCGESSSAFWNAASDSLKRPAASSASPSESCGFGSCGMMRTYSVKAAIAPSASRCRSAA